MHQEIYDNQVDIHFGFELEILFFQFDWEMISVSGSGFYRPLPPLPDLEISEESVVMVADVLRVWVNRILSVAQDIAIGRNVKLFLQVRRYFPFRLTTDSSQAIWTLEWFFCVDLQVGSGLWVASCVGSFFNFLTLVYMSKGLTVHKASSFSQFWNFSCSWVFIMQVLSLVFRFQCCMISTRSISMRSFV